MLAQGSRATRARGEALWGPGGSTLGSVPKVGAAAGGRGLTLGACAQGPAVTSPDSELCRGQHMCARTHGHTRMRTHAHTLIPHPARVHRPRGTLRDPPTAAPQSPKSPPASEHALEACRRPGPGRGDSRGPVPLTPALPAHRFRRPSRGSWRRFWWWWAGGRWRTRKPPRGPSPIPGTSPSTTPEPVSDPASELGPLS